MNFIDRILKYFGYIKAENKSPNSSDKGDNIIPLSNSATPTPKPVSIDKFALAYNKGTEEILFEKIDSNLIPAEYRCVQMERQSRQELYNALSTGAGVASFGASAYPLTGLYKATASAGELMKLSSGGVGSSVIGANGKIVAQKGFIQVAIFLIAIIFFEPLVLVNNVWSIVDAVNIFRGKMKTATGEELV